MSELNFKELGLLALKGVDLNFLKTKGPYLLGIDWCHLYNKTSVLDSSNVPIEGMTVQENTGMAGVIPAWKITEVLNCEEVVGMRKALEKEIQEAEKHVVLDAAEDVDSEGAGNITPAVPQDPTHDR